MTSPLNLLGNYPHFKTHTVCHRYPRTLSPFPSKCCGDVYKYSLHLEHWGLPTLHSLVCEEVVSGDRSVVVTGASFKTQYDATGSHRNRLFMVRSRPCNVLEFQLPGSSSHKARPVLLYSAYSDSNKMRSSAAEPSFSCLIEYTLSQGRINR